MNIQIMYLEVLSFYLLRDYAIPIGASRTNFKVIKFELCNSTQGLIKFNGNITTEGIDQYFSYDMTTPIPWDDQIGGTCRIESKTFENIYTELFTIREKNFCKAVHKYMGEFSYDIERAAQLLPGVCPIPAGTYHVRHLKMDFTKITLQTFPFGRIRFTMRVRNNRNALAHLVCWLIEVDNKLN